MRKSGTSRLNLNLSNVDQEAVRKIDEKHDSFTGLANTMVPIIQYQLELLDNLELVSKGSLNQNTSLLYKIVIELIGLDSRYLQSRSYHFDNAIAAAVKRGEINCIEGIIFSKRGAPKNKIEEQSVRRMSFAATSYFDNTELLRVEALKQMTDLEFFFSMNGYHLPYATSTNRRSMYESFFNVFIEEVMALDAQNEKLISPERYLFQILQETIYSIHMITEYSVSVAECIIEMVTVVNTRLKGLSMDINLKLPNYSGASSPVLDHLLSCFHDENKVFPQFMTRKLLLAVNELKTTGPIDWLSKISNYGESLNDAIEGPYQQAAIGLERSIQSLRNGLPLNQMFEPDTNNEIKGDLIGVYLTDVELYVSEFKKFIILLGEEQSIYHQLYQSMIDLLEGLVILQQQYPVKYGGHQTPRTPRSGNGRSLTASPSSSPRTGSNPESPRTPTSSSNLSNSRGIISKISSLFSSSK